MSRSFREKIDILKKQYELQDAETAQAREFVTVSDEDREKILSADYSKVPPRPDQPDIAKPNNMKWVPDWKMSDEFTPDKESGETDLGKWNLTNETWLGRPPGYFKEENVDAKNGEMRLHSRDDDPLPEYPEEYHSFSTAFVQTKKIRKFGYFEVIVRLMDSNISSSFWFKDNPNNGWNTEIDVFEFSTSTKTVSDDRKFSNLFATNLHIHDAPDESLIGFNKPISYDIGADLSRRNIKVGLNWQSDRIEWYLNDVLLRTEKTTDFHQPLHLQFDSETMDSWFGETTPGDNGRLPGMYRILSVRTWYLTRNDD